MKKLLLSILTITLAISCIKSAPAPDPADAFVGSYTYTDNYYVRWGGDSKSSSYQGQFTLTKVSALEVQMHGPWTTLGTVSGKTVSFGACPQVGDDGYVNYTFGVANLIGNQLTFSYSGSGSQRYTNGVSYPWESAGNVIATKLN